MCSVKRFRDCNAKFDHAEPLLFEYIFPHGDGQESAFHILLKAFIEIYENIVQSLLMFKKFLSHDSEF